MNKIANCILVVVSVVLVVGCADESPQEPCAAQYDEQCEVSDAGVPALTRQGFLPQGPCRTNGVPCPGGVKR